jgi:hypothetical protein
MLSDDVEIEDSGLAQHSAATDSWGTPPQIVKASRGTLGGIDVDPFTDEYWNKHCVQAPLIYTAERSAFDPNIVWERGARWHVNSPGGQVREAWELTYEHWKHGGSAFWVGFNLEQLAYLQEFGLMDDGIAKAIPRHRVSYLQTPAAYREKLLVRARKAEKKGEYKAVQRLLIKAAEVDLAGAPIKGDSPTHSSYLALLPQAGIEGRLQIAHFSVEMGMLGAKSF